MKWLIKKAMELVLADFKRDYVQYIEEHMTSPIQPNIPTLLIWLEDGEIKETN